jgi:hypothetical protein
MPSRTPPMIDPVELSLEDAVLDTWLEDTGEYLRIDTPELPPAPLADVPPAPPPSATRASARRA